MFEEIYKVEQEEYSSFLDQIIPEARKIETTDIDEDRVGVVVYSKNTNTPLCGRIVNVEKDDEPDIYYIFNMPQDNERRAARAIRKIELTDREQVETLLKFITEQINKKGEKNVGNI
jgi:hypothetical protein